MRFKQSCPPPPPAMEPKQQQQQGPHYIMVEGLRFAEGFVPETIRSALEYQPRPDDVFVVTYPKCGTTWMMQIVLLVLHEGRMPESAEEYFSCTPCLEMLGARAAERMPRPSPIRSHLPFDMMPFADYAKYIYVARNPRDCCVSLYHHTRTFPAYQFGEGGFDDFFRLFVRGRTDYNDYFDHLLSWYERRDDPNVLFLTYEQLRRDTRGCVLRVADFLGERYGRMARGDPKLLDRVLRHCSFDFMRQDMLVHWKDALKPLRRDSGQLPAGLVSWAEGAVEEQYGLRRFGPMLSVRDIVRRGSFVEWETELSSAQEHKLERRIREKTAHSDVMDLWQPEDK